MKKTKNEKTNDEYNCWVNVKKAFKYVKEEKTMLIVFISINIFLCIVGAFIPLFSAKQLLYMTDGLFKNLIYASIIVLSIELTKNIGQFFSRKSAQIFHREMIRKLQRDLAIEMLRVETSELDKYSSGALISRLTNDSKKVSDIFIDINFSVSDFITNIGILLAIFIINRWLFLYIMSVVVILFILDSIRIKKFNEMDKEHRKTADITTGLISELVRGVRDIKVLNASDSFVKNVDEKINKMNQQRYKMNTITRSFNALFWSVKDILDFVLICLFIFMINRNTLSIGNAIIIYMYRDKVYNLLSAISFMMESFKDFNLSAGRVFDIIGDDTYEKEVFGTKHIDKIKGDFEFKDVWFSYNKKDDVLKGVSFKIKHNTTVSFVGKSGAGKSTIFSLLARLYKIDKGDILIDGINISELDSDSIRGNISIITQNPYIFNMSIRDNLTIVKEGLTEEEMIKACKMACLHDYIIDLPDGYDTIVGEGGLTLSGGQRQRLAIARALVQKTEIILFDEATSALDNETQQSIQDAINNMKNKYTILIIAHRLSTVINSDNIFFIDDGVITDSGSHEELLENNKEYKRLYNLELKVNK